MEIALAELQEMKPTEKDLKQLAPQLNVPTNFKKDALLKQIRDALLSRKGMAERVNV